MDAERGCVSVDLPGQVWSLLCWHHCTIDIAIGLAYDSHCASKIRSFDHEFWFVKSLLKISYQL